MLDIRTRTRDSQMGIVRNRRIVYSVYFNVGNINRKRSIVLTAVFILSVYRNSTRFRSSSDAQKIAEQNTYSR